MARRHHPLGFSASPFSMALACHALAIVLPDSGLIPYSTDVATARDWNYFEALLPYNVIITGWVAFMAASVVALIGMWFYWSPSRWLLAGSYALSIAITPFLGLVVTSPLETTVAAIGSTLLVWLVAVSFWSPLSQRFVGHVELSRT